MINLKFEDYLKQKYIYTGIFKEGLARVKNLEELWGYINEKGEEVIPCQFNHVSDFSEGRAIVTNEEFLRGYIDITGKLVINYQYFSAGDFNEGLATVQVGPKAWKYINKDGKDIITEIFEFADSFSDGYALVKKRYQSCWTYVDKQGQTHGQYKCAERFSEGLAVVETDSDIKVINKSFEIINQISKTEHIKVHSYHYGLALGANGTYFGYFDKQLNLKIPFAFEKGKNFSDGIAVATLSPYFLGIINAEGKITAFSVVKYQQIRDFSEGLAAVKNTRGLWGYINKEGEEVIPCQYKDVDNFSEGLAGVIDTEDVFHYIDQEGNNEITIGDIYYSVLELDDKTIYIKADSEDELNNKKLEILRLVKQELVEKTIDMIDQLAYDRTEGLYQKSKGKVKTPLYISNINNKL